MGSLNKEVTSPLEANLPFINTDIDFDVEMEIIESNSYETSLDEFVALTSKAIFEYSTRFDAVLAEHGPSTFYNNYIRWRRLATLLQSAYKDKLELKLAETDLTNLNLEIDRFLKEAEAIFGVDFVEEMKESGGKHGDTT